MPPKLPRQTRRQSNFRCAAVRSALVRRAECNRLRKGFQPLTRRCDSGLRRSWQGGRGAPASGRIQRVVKLKADQAAFEPAQLAERMVHGDVRCNSLDMSESASQRYPYALLSKRASTCNGEAKG
jgi:hypothetical protein